MYGGKTRDKNGPMGNKISKQIGTHHHANGAPDCGLKIAGLTKALRSKRREVFLPILGSCYTTLDAKLYIW